MTHRLHLDQNARAEDLHALALTWYPEATLNGTTLRLTDSCTITFDELAESWELAVPKQRDTADAPEVPDGYGLDKAFPEGAPIDDERDVLDFALGAVRRLGGTLVTDTCHELSPHPFMLPDLTVVSPYQLSPDQTLEVVRDIVPEAELAPTADESTPSDAPYALVLPIFSEAELQVQVERIEHEIPAISHVAWVQEGAVSYTVTFLPHDESRAVSDSPDPSQIKMWQEAYLGCAAIAKALHDAVGGLVLDVDEFLVDAEALF